MEREEVESFVADKVTEAMRSCQNDLLTGINTLISSEVQKISDNQKSFSELQLSKIEAISSSDYKFKRKSNEEQYKVNSKVINKIQDCERNIDSSDMSQAKENLAEASNLLKQRQKVIRIADESEMGWKVVDEYIQSEVASDEEDQKRIYRAQARASRKAKSERGRRARRWFPYRPRAQQTVASSTLPVTQPQQQQPQQQQRRLGLCFSCGESGHWKFECPHIKKNVKLSSVSESFSVSDQPTCLKSNNLSNVDSLIYERQDDKGSSAGKAENVVMASECEHIINQISNEADTVSNSDSSSLSPFNRLRNNRSKWKEAGANSHILKVIEEGYKIPFTVLPDVQKSKNNKSARDNPDFVKEEISKLLAKRCISEIQEEPHVINPLTVAYNKKGKPRLVLDCRNINDNLFKFRFKYEDIQTARQLFKKGMYMFSFDIRGAYNHIDIYHKHRTFLGFSWSDGNTEHFYVYNSLPFGLASAGHIFSKVLRVVVLFWRSQGHRVVTFLDDGLGGNESYDKALSSSRFIRQSLIELGFLLSDEKCQWQPTLQITWLGYFFCMRTGKFFITQERIDRIEQAIRSMIMQLESQEYKIVPAKFAASVVGQIISTQFVLGKVVRLKTRELYKCIESRLSWHSPVFVSVKAFEELQFWLSEVRGLNSVGRDISESTSFEVALFCDASSVGYGGYLELNNLCGTHSYPNSEVKVRQNISYMVKADDFRFVDKVLASPEEEAVSNVEKSKAGIASLKKQFSSPEVEVVDELVNIKARLVSPEVETELQSWSEVNSVSPEVENGISNKQRLRKSPEEELRRRETVGSEVKINAPETVIEHKTSNNIVLHNINADHSIGHEVIGVWQSGDKDKSSTWREAEAVKRVMQSNKADIRGLGLTRNIQQRLSEVNVTQEGLAERISSYLISSRADKTTEKYKTTFNKFKSFCVERGYQCLPANPIHVTIYFSHLLDQNVSYGIISAAFYAVKWVHNINSYIDPTENGFVKGLLESAKRLRSQPVKRKDVVNSDMLIQLCDQYILNANLLDVRDLSMILLGYSGFLRFDEISNLHSNDISFEENYLVLTIRKSKTDKFRAGNKVYISKGNSSACAYSMVRRYIDLAGIDIKSNGFLFKPIFKSKGVHSLIHKDKPISYTRSRECIVRKLKSVAPDLNLGTHSLRAGGATTVANSGAIDDRCLMRHGRWKSQESKNMYIDDSVSKKLKITQALAL